jgi:alpha-galactosidase/6-phospho-beta-glucosidase family protein
MLSESFPDVKASVYAFDYDKLAEKNKNVQISKEPETCVKDKDLIINLISYRQSYSKKYQEISEKYGVNIMNALPSLDLIRCFDILGELDKFAEALKKAENKAPVINGGEPIDIITSYLNKAHGITTYGISRKAGVAADTLLSAAGLTKYSGKINYRLAGVMNNLWLLYIQDKKGKDLYPEIKDKFKSLNLNVKRNDLTRDSLKSLKFYGFYHSYDALKERAEDVLLNFIKAFSEGGEAYFNFINKDSVSGLDGEAVVEAPCTVLKKEIKAEKVELPLQCALAVTDYASAVSVAVKTLIDKDIDNFRRAIKLDPYLKLVLTLKELDNLIDDVLLIEENLTTLFSRRAL